MSSIVSWKGEDRATPCEEIWIYMSVVCVAMKWKWMLNVSIKLEIQIHPKKLEIQKHTYRGYGLILFFRISCTRGTFYFQSTMTFFCRESDVDISYVYVHYACMPFFYKDFDCWSMDYIIYMCAYVCNGNKKKKKKKFIICISSLHFSFAGRN